VQDWASLPRCPSAACPCRAPNGSLSRFTKRHTVQKEARMGPGHHGSSTAPSAHCVSRETPAVRHLREHVVHTLPLSRPLAGQGALHACILLIERAALPALQKRVQCHCRPKGKAVDHSQGVKITLSRPIGSAASDATSPCGYTVAGLHGICSSCGPGT
jgi:hypothetical protein